MLAIIDVDYKAADIVKNLSRDDYLRLRELVPTLKLANWPDGHNEAPSWYSYGTTVIDLSSDAAVLSSYGITYTVEKIKNSYTRSSADEKGNSITLNFALPNIGLLSIDEVTWEEDCCTQRLQNQLEDGWRILAVCPPNGARRPDYILGRMKR